MEPNIDDPQNHEITQVIKDPIPPIISHTNKKFPIILHQLFMVISIE